MGNKQKFISEVVRWCEDNSRGYSQPKRWAPNAADCSSLMYRCGVFAGYNLPTSGTRYTGTMLNDFQAAGWTAVPFDGNLYDCEPGCIALNVTSHTEAFVDWGQLGGAHIDEHGGVQGCCDGDQTGNEISVGPAYTPSYGWDWILIPPEDGSDAPVDDVPTVDLPMPRFRVYTREDGWLEWLTGLRCDCSCGDDFAGVTGHWIYDVEFDQSSLGANGWYTIIRADGSETTDRSGNTTSPIVGLIVYYDTPNPDQTGYYKAEYRVHWLGSNPGWGKWEYDDEDGGAGKDEDSPLDMIQITLAKA